MTNARIPHASVSDVGMRRDHNEDSVLVEPPLVVVADGVGGSAKGEVASSLAIETFAGCAHGIVAARTTDDALRAMEDAVLTANAAVHESQLHDETRRGMATTITAAAVRDGGEIVVGHVGDSRLYVLSAAGARQVSEDHSVVAELVRSGRIDAEEAAQHPQRNVITRALGPDDDVSVDAFVVHAGPGDWLLACSDGLTEHVSDHELAVVVLENGGDPDRAARMLVDLANSRGGSDNITVALVQPVPSDVSGELRVEQLRARAAQSDTLPKPLGADEKERDDGAADPEPEQRDVEISGEIPVLQPMTGPDEERAGGDDEALAADRRALARMALLLVVLVAAVAALWSQCSFLAAATDADADESLTVRRGMPHLNLSHEVRRFDEMPRRDWPEDVRDAVEQNKIYFRKDPDALVESLSAEDEPSDVSAEAARP